ncbi:MAG: helix-turn-helix transcriptional regulator [Candidatus Dormibacteraeota bacterium]|nr:helix-turn-helix transcriptional regulator [Candidatus Dormibacteraeota bacterium]
MSRGRPVPVDSIEAARQRRGWTITELAEAADVSIATASRACAGRPVSAETVWKLAAAFERFPANTAIERLLQGRA